MKDLIISKKQALVSISVDDGHPLDLKTAEILAKKNIEAIFYIPIKNSTGKPTLNKTSIRTLSQKFEIGCHTYNHIDLTRVPFVKAREEILSGKKALEDIIGIKIRSFAWPWGKYNKKLINLVESLGFSNCRSASIINFNVFSKNAFLLKPNLHIYPHSILKELRACIKEKDLYSLIMRLKLINKTHLGLIDIFKQMSIPFHVWFHSWEIEQYDLWDIIKRI